MGDFDCCEHDPSVVSDQDAQRIVSNLCAEYGVNPGELVRELTSLTLTIDACAQNFSRDNHEGCAVALDGPVGALRDLRNRIATHRCPPAAPEIVTGDQAQKLPIGSIVVRDYSEHDYAALGLTPPVVRYPLTRSEQGWREHEHDRRPDVPFAGYRFRVLYRAPEPVAPPKVGDVIETAAQLDALPGDARLVYSDSDGRPMEGSNVRAARTIPRSIGAPLLVLDLGPDQ